MRDFLTALCLALVIEGVAYALCPGVMQRLMARVCLLPSNGIRMFGVMAVAMGVAGVWLVRAAIVAP